LEAPPVVAGDIPLWVYLLGLAILTAAGAAIRAAWLNHPMRYDESWGFLEYIWPRQISACLVYSAPNNHVLHTLLVALASAIGGDSPAVLRMPAFLIGVALIPATGHLAAVLGGRRAAGWIAAALVACSAVLVDYSVNARGYGLVCLATVLMAWQTVRICHNARLVSPWVLWTLLAALGLFTLPIMLYPMIVLAAIIVLQALIGPADQATRRLALRRTAASFAAAIAMAFILYLPVFRATGLAATEENPADRQSPLFVYSIGLYALTANPFVQSRSFAEAAAGLPRVGVEAIGDWTCDSSPLAWGLAAVGLLAATVAGLRRRRLLYLLAVLLPTLWAGLSLAQRVVPFARVWLFALPLLMAVASCGLVELAGLFRPARLRTAAVIVLLLAMAAASAQAAWRVVRPGRAVLGECCLPDARAIVADGLELADGRTGMTWDYEVPNWPPLAYYLATFSSPEHHFVPYLGADCRRVLVVVPAGQTLASVLEHRPQLAETYGPMELWRRYPSAEVYLAPRKSAPSSSPSR
jgi:4-amino-4-deoxy-L-arabinose transferase-like glycosyltransferase